MSISMHSASVPICSTMLANLGHCIDKAQAFVEARKCEPTALTQYRLAPDMLPFTRQVLLKERINKTIAFIESVPADKLIGTEAREITFPVGREATRTMAAEAYLKHWMLPNLFFHVTTAYAILRHNGVELGKGDYLLGAGA